MDRIKLCKSSRGSTEKKRCKTGNSNIVFLWKYTQYLILSFQQLLLETLSILGSEIYGRLTLCSNTIWKAFSKQGGGAVGRREKLVSLNKAPIYQAEK